MAEASPATGFPLLLVFLVLLFAMVVMTDFGQIPLVVPATKVVRSGQKTTHFILLEHFDGLVLGDGHEGSLVHQLQSHVFP